MLWGLKQPLLGSWGLDWHDPLWASARCLLNLLVRLSKLLCEELESFVFRLDYLLCLEIVVVVDYLVKCRLTVLGASTLHLNKCPFDWFIDLFFRFANLFGYLLLIFICESSLDLLASFSKFFLSKLFLFLLDLRREFLK